MAVDKQGANNVVDGCSANGRRMAHGRRTGDDGMVPQREAVERSDKTHKEEEMIVTGYRDDGSRAMIVTNDPKTLKWFSERFERTEYKAFNKKGVSNG